MPPPAEKPLTMAEWKARDRSDLRFHVGIRVYLAVIFAAAFAFSAGWIGF